MELLKEIVRKQGLRLSGKTLFREAVRGVVIKDKALLMIYSSQNGDYKFPGGGVDPGETYEAALIREVMEECGATISSIGQALGYIVEYDIPAEEEYDLCKMVSYYYVCEVDPDFGEQSLDQYEKELGFIPVWVDICKAISINQALIVSNRFPRWTPRELFVLEHIKEEFGL